MMIPCVIPYFLILDSFGQFWPVFGQFFAHFWPARLFYYSSLHLQFTCIEFVNCQTQRQVKTRLYENHQSSSTFFSFLDQYQPVLFTFWPGQWLHAAVIVCKYLGLPLLGNTPSFSQIGKRQPKLFYVFSFFCQFWPFFGQLGPNA